MVDSGRNFLKKRIIPLLVSREYMVPPSELGVFTKIKDRPKEVEGAFHSRREVFCHKPTDKAPGV